MKWFDKWFAKKCKQAWEEANQPQEAEPAGYAIGVNTPKVRPSRIRGDSDGTLSTRGTQFTLYNANGGNVVELRDYNENTDRITNVLYVIPSDKDLGQELGHIVTMEALKR